MDNKINIGYFYMKIIIKIKQLSQSIEKDNQKLDEQPLN